MRLTWESSDSRPLFFSFSMVLIWTHCSGFMFVSFVSEIDFAGLCKLFINFSILFADVLFRSKVLYSRRVGSSVIEYFLYFEKHCSRWEGLLFIFFLSTIYWLMNLIQVNMSAMAYAMCMFHLYHHKTEPRRWYQVYFSARFQIRLNLYLRKWKIK